MNAEFPIGEADLVALIGSRICHDLVSPVGAIGNGVELLGMAGATGEPGAELDLVRESVENAQARLRFFRLAFGHSGPEQEVGRAEVLGILTQLYGDGRLRVHWAVEGARPRAEVKLALLLLLCLESAMPYGGQVHVSRDAEGWRVHGEAEKLRIEPAVWEALASGAIPADLRPSQVHFGLVHAAAARARRRLYVAVADRAVTLSA
jgi:histidine phosphotransferase ChpT